MSASAPVTSRGRATRERIVRAAANLVAERGVAALSLDAVGNRAAASRSQLYHYFEDRDALIRAAVGATSEDVLRAQEQLLAGVDSWASLDRWFSALVDMQHERQARGGCPIGSLSGQLAERDPQARAAIAGGLDRWEALLRAALVRLQERGRLASAADPRALATATMAAIQGGLLLTQVRRDPQQLRAALDGARAMLRSNSPGLPRPHPARRG